MVRRIFALTADGIPTKRIAAMLNQEGIPAPHDGGRGNKLSRGWGSTTVRYILRNENYLGRWVWNRNRFSRIPGTNGYKHVPRPEKEHVRKEIPETRIIDQDLWDRAHRALGPKRVAQNANLGVTTKPGSLLSGLVKCGMCGGAIIIRGRKHKKNGVSYTSLGCGIYQSRGPSICSNNRTISARKLTEVVVSVLRDMLTLPRAGLVDAVSEGFKRRQQDSAPSRVKDLERQISVTESKIRNLTDALSKMGFVQAVADRMKEENDRLVALRAELSGARKDDRPKIVAHPKVVDAFIRDLLRYIDDPDTEQDRAKARALLQKCMPSVLLTPIGDGKFRVNGGFRFDTFVEQGPEKLVCGSSSRRDRD